MGQTSSFEPEQFQIVSEPRQLKAFSDPLRLRILHILSDREATNQQLAAAVGETQAKVLHHVRFLLDAGLIKQTEQRIRGGNVEKYYRATARLYGIRTEASGMTPVVGSVFESLLQELVASYTLWPDQPHDWEMRRVRLAPERVAEFRERLNALIDEYWGGPDAPVTPDVGAELMAFASVVFRYPGAVDEPE